MSPPSVRAVLFDATGTLFELREPLGETYARAGRAHGAHISPWRLEEAFARVWRAAPPCVFAGLPADEVETRERAWWREVVRQTFLAADSAERPADLDTCFDALFLHFADARAWRLRPGAQTALRALHAQEVACAVVSNFDHRLPGLLAGLGLDRWLDAVVTPSAAGAAKPDAAIFRFALERLGVAADDAVFVGNDALRDLAAARAAGLRAVDVASLATLAELPALLRHPRGASEAKPPEEPDPPT